MCTICVVVFCSPIIRGVIQQRGTQVNDASSDSLRMPQVRGTNEQVNQNKLARAADFGMQKAVVSTPRHLRGAAVTPRSVQIPLGVLGAWGLEAILGDPRRCESYWGGANPTGEI